MDLYFDMTMVHDGDFNHVDDHDDDEVDDDGEPLPLPPIDCKAILFPSPHSSNLLYLLKDLSISISSFLVLERVIYLTPIIQNSKEAHASLFCTYDF